ncbi:MAG: translation initiation factor IF-6, partial [Candidatus Aenigmarchaeota archaeon]|nr:translation initiation factor IF-6 [Candidatus Aenigmarchaeota archaeon]
GLFMLATDKYILIPDDSIDVKNMGVKKIIANAYDTPLTGLFFAGNSKCLIVPSNIDKDEIQNLKENLPKSVKLHLLNVKENALGNLILTNDKVSFISPLLEQDKKEIETALGTKTYVLNMEDRFLPAIFFVLTNKGFLCSNDIGEKDFKYVEEKSKLEGDYGSVNFGSIFIKAGLVANSNKYIAGGKTTGPEIARIDKCLSFLE